MFFPLVPRPLQAILSQRSIHTGQVTPYHDTVFMTRKGVLRDNSIELTRTTGPIDEHTRTKPLFQNEDGAEIGTMMISVSHDISHRGISYGR